MTISKSGPHNEPVHPQPSLGPVARILIVDDDVSVSDAFSRILRLEGHEVWAAFSGEEGLSLAHQHTPDAVIVDLRMPAASGLRLLRAIRTLPALHHTPVAIVTGDYYASDVEVREITASGASLSYKPLWLDELVTLARDLLAVAVKD